MVGTEKTLNNRNTATAHGWVSEYIRSRRLYLPLNSAILGNLGKERSMKDT